MQHKRLFRVIQHKHTYDGLAYAAYDAYNDAVWAYNPVLADEAAPGACDAVALAEAADVVNVPVPEAVAAVAVQEVCVVQKYCYYLLSTSRKLKLKTSSWHFFFVS